MEKFAFIETELKGLCVIEPTVFTDSRGFFKETYNQREFKENNLTANFVQDNCSRSVKGVLRGLHYQKNYPQCKLIRVSKGEIFDISVDIRKESETYGKWFGVYLSESNKKQVYVPEGFAHGFLVLSEEADVCYKCSNFYFPNDEHGIIWNDEDLNIKWPTDGTTAPILSEKDKGWGLFREL